MEEVWKDVVGYEGLYKVSNLGNVVGIKRGKILAPQERRHGYLAVCLYGKPSKNGRFRQVSVHRLVAEAFIPNPNGYEEVNHKDENKQNNLAENLEWCSHKQNSSYGTRGKRIGKANKNGKKSTPVKQYTLDGKLVNVFPSIAEADRNGFNRSGVWLCVSGKQNHAYGYIWRYAD